MGRMQARRRSRTGDHPRAREERTEEERTARMAALRALAVKVERDADKTEAAGKEETRLRMAAHLVALRPRPESDTDSLGTSGINAAAVARYLDDTRGSGSASAGPSDVRSYLQPFARGSGSGGEARDSRRSGCLEQEEARGQLEELVKTWGYPDQRGGWLDWAMAAKMPQEAEERRAGANSKRKKRRGKGVDPVQHQPQNLLGPEAVRDMAKPEDTILTDLKTHEDWEKAKLELILDKLASSTIKSYSIGWRWWSLFCRARGISPLREISLTNRREEEELLLEFVAHLSRREHKKAGTIKQYLSAIQAQHLALGMGDITAGVGRLWMAIDGLRRRDGAAKRKKPVTPRMMRWIEGSCSHRGHARKRPSGRRSRQATSSG